MRSAEPFIVRFFTGLRGPKQKILGMEQAGGFVTALLLPIVIWFITRALGSVLNV